MAFAINPRSYTTSVDSISRFKVAQEISSSSCRSLAKVEHENTKCMEKPATEV